jgi:Leucine-rich repeat (LRR) protein
LIYLSQYFSDVVCEALLGLPSRVQGLLPTEIGLLSSLRVLHLIDMMNIQGGLPSQFGQLSNLSVLQISNSFDQEIFFSYLLSRFPLMLEHLTISGSYVIGQIPTDISSFQSLISLNIYDTGTGTLPSEIGLMTKLKSLKIQFTFMKGNIPSEIGKLTHLTCLNLEMNNFADVLPSEISQLSNLNSNIFNQVC